MLKRILLFVIASTLLLSCGKKSVSTCQDKVCTEEFAMITLSFKDKNGNADFARIESVTNKRTNKPVDRSGSASLDMMPGAYLVIDDNSKKDLSEGGDDIEIIATGGAKSQTKTITMKVAGGACACHIQKISGPDTVQFD